ncbi:MAG: SUMF1/EgtB/PvdO family nonheme iron enzyme [Xenococcus sp. MO_188.B8]|nr:SUMF1/EgtB/PvdO family nonheme iron enzyme [Xenococcus sp. MO_188.B8]
MKKKSDIQIFLAHAHDDKEVVLQLYHRLKDAGYKPWLDKKDLKGGQNWRSEIPKVIKNSQLFIACFSKLSVARIGFFQNEFKIAFNHLASLSPNSIYFIPLRFDDCEIPDLRLPEYGLNLWDIHRLDYFENDGFGKLEDTIIHEFGPFVEDPIQDIQIQYFTEDLGNDVELEMVHIPDGTFMMGSPEGEGHDDENPQHQVTVSSFYMGKYLITQEQYQQVMGQNPSLLKKGKNRPVEHMTWDNAEEFCKKLSDISTKKYKYRLPSEAEWEYACRAQKNTLYHFGEFINRSLVNCGNHGGTTNVGIFRSNNFGLYDMHGNLWEWCQDDWHKNYEGAPNDGSAWVSVQSSRKVLKVLRGGSWIDPPDKCRSAFRGKCKRDEHFNTIGFRVVCDVPDAH